MDDLEAALIENRRRRFADMAATPVPEGQMVGRVMRKPGALDYMAAALRQYGGRKGEQMAEQELRGLQDSRRAAETQDLQRFSEILRGTPITPQTQGNNPSAFTPEMPGVAPDPMAAYGVLAQSRSPALRQAGMQGMARIPELEMRRVERAEDQAFKRSEREAAAAARMQQLQDQHQMRMDMLVAQNASREQMAAAQRDFQSQMAEAQRQFQREMKSLGGASQQPYFQPVQTAQGVFAFNARTGQVEPVRGPDGKPIIGAAADPALQGQITGAETTARKGAESAQEARNEARKASMFLQQLNQAEEILNQGPTESGIGSAVDTAARIVGVSTAGAQRAAQLEALSGWLVANVPRMEGPQSNFDVQNYMTMAAKIGDRTVPVPERLAALKEVRRLQEKYKVSAEQRMNAGAPKPADSSVTVNGKTYTRPAGMTDQQWAEYKKAVGVSQ